MKSIALTQFHADAELRAADKPQRDFVRNALHGYMATRLKTQSLFSDYTAARDLAAEIKWRAIENLPALLEQFEANLVAKGVHVHWAIDAASARQQILRVIESANASKIIKSKSMATEEVHLNDALVDAGHEVIESDLGEFIQQLREEPPYHFVFPSMHVKRGEIRTLFEKHYPGTVSDDPEALTLYARNILREKYLSADVGISGANFGVADIGAISITENEGNARLTCALPRVHIVLMGIEKIVPTLEDLALLHPMLGTCGAGQLLTGYNTVYFGPKLPGEVDGPEEMHVVLLDNGRTKLLADPSLRDALRCIRCGACLNVCPIFSNVGGHTYGTTYQGPIGAVISPPMRGVNQYGHLAFASSLCGACTETCPVKIDLHHHLLRIRQQFTRVAPKFFERIEMKLFAFGMRHPATYRRFSRIGLTIDGLMKPLHGGRFDPLRAWRKRRTLPVKPRQSFMQWWRARRSA